MLSQKNVVLRRWDVVLLGKIVVPSRWDVVLLDVARMPVALVTARWNEEVLHQEGVMSVNCFWRHLKFAGWVAVKS